jgi:hypothetical protein
MCNQRFGHYHIYFWYNRKTKGDAIIKILFQTYWTVPLEFLLKQEKPCTKLSSICHIFERMILYLYQYYGVSIYFGESIDKISDNLKKLDQLSLLLFQDFWRKYTIKFTQRN